MNRSVNPNTRKIFGVRIFAGLQVVRFQVKGELPVVELICRFSEKA